MVKDETFINLSKKVLIEVFLLGCLILVAVATDKLWDPFQRGFFCGDQSIMYPYKEDTVKVWMLRTVCLGLPFICFVACEWAYLNRERDEFRVFGVRVPAWMYGVYCACISYCTGFCFVEIITDFGKNVIGRYRPWFLEICRPSVNCSLPEFQGQFIEAAEFTCTSGMESQYKNMRRSFPSGHATLGAYAAIYLAVYLERRMTWRGPRAVRHTLQFGALLLSWFSALSRISDNRHHWSDVFVGYMLGAAIGASMMFGTELVKKQKEHIVVPQFEVSSRQLQFSST